MHAILGEDAQLRLGLQQRSAYNLRRHVQRAVVRIGVLVGADLGAFVLMRSAVRAVRDRGILGFDLAEALYRVLPPGYLSGWQFGAALLVGLFFTGNYGQGDNRRNPGRLLAGAALATALPLWMAIWERGLGLVLAQYAFTATVVWLALTGERYVIDRVVAVVRPPEQDAVKTLFVGPADKVHEAQQMKVFKSRDCAQLGFVEVAPAATNGALGLTEDLPRILHETHAEAVVLCGFLPEGHYERVVEAAMAAGCELIAVPRSLRASGIRPQLLWRDGEPLVRLTAPALQARQLIAKRVMDVGCAVLGLVLISPVLLAVGLLIKLDSRGPVFFRQQRAGFGGKSFGMLKFRTMVADADLRKEDLAHLNHTGDPRLFKILDDPRVTRVGRWLRKWSLDELPQLWNVLVGDMSLVGPRPFFPADLPQYEMHHFDRLGTRPGITGLWQVSGRSAVLDFEEVVRLDREYIDKWSLLLDLRILVLTLPAVVRRTGAY
jgi:exopolysaccharide biosynthesis polyprenyl glycosylphosphotransferase